MKLVRLALPLALTLSSAALPACAVDADEAASSEHASTDPSAAPYPIVLAHGFFGFEDFAGVDFIQYFQGVRADLAARGETRVFTPTVDPFNDSVTRGKQLQAEVEDIVRRTGSRKVNIIGHSQGGLDARYVAHERPDLVASVVTFATPHHGTPLADHFARLDHPFTSWALDGAVQILGAPLWERIGRDTSIVRSFRQFSSANIARFNRDYPDVPGIPYWSLTGRTAGSLGGDACAAPHAPPFVARWRETRDTTEPLLKVPQVLLSGWSGAPNDGLVLVESARWGTFLGCVPADHFDEIGQLFADPAGLGNGWSHLDFYADLVAFLRREGL